MTDKLLNKSLLILLIAMGVISAVLLIMFFIQVVPLSEEAQMEHSTTSAFLNWGYFLTIACAIAAIAFPLVDFIKALISNPKSAIKTIAVIAALAIIVGISYAMSSSEESSLAFTTVPSTPGERKWSGTGLNVTYILLGLNVLAIMFLEIFPKIRK